MEAYVTPMRSGVQPGVLHVAVDDELPVAAAQTQAQDKLTSLVEKLVERIDKIEKEITAKKSSKTPAAEQRRSAESSAKGPTRETQQATSRFTRRGGQQALSKECWFCGRRGHVAWQCRQRMQQGN